MEIKVLGRINELARIAKERELTPEEVEERARLRKEYLKEFRAMMTQTLDNTYIQYPDNTRERLTRKKPELKKD